MINPSCLSITGLWMQHFSMAEKHRQGVLFLFWVAYLLNLALCCTLFTTQIVTPVASRHTILNMGHRNKKMNLTGNVIRGCQQYEKHLIMSFKEVIQRLTKWVSIKLSAVSVVSARAVILTDRDEFVLGSFKRPHTVLLNFPFKPRVSPAFSLAFLESVLQYWS